MPAFLTNPDLMERLIAAQNHPLIVGKQDIISIAGMFDTREELERHVSHYEDRIAQAVAA